MWCVRRPCTGLKFSYCNGMQWNGTERNVLYCSVLSSSAMQCNVMVSYVSLGMYRFDLAQLNISILYQPRSEYIQTALVFRCLEINGLRLPTENSGNILMISWKTRAPPQTNSEFASENRLCREQSSFNKVDFLWFAASFSETRRNLSKDFSTKNKRISHEGRVLNRDTIRTSTARRPSEILGMIKLKLMSELVFAKASVPLKTSINSCGYHCISKPNFA